MHVSAWSTKQIISMNSSLSNAAYMRQWIKWALVQIMACQCQAIIYTNAELLSVGPLETNFSEILIKYEILHS